MGIPTRPDDVNSFINGAEPPAQSEEDARLDALVHKTLRLRLRYHHMLEDEAKARSRKEARRVTQTDTLDEILAEWAKRNGY